MGLRQNLIDAELEAAKIAGSDITEPTPAMIKKAELTTNAIVDFLTQAKFTVTKFNAPIILEDFMIPPQKGDILTSVTTEIPAGGVQVVGSPASQQSVAPTIATVKQGTDGVKTHKIDISKDAGGLLSTGYAFIGQDPKSQAEFDVTTEDNQSTNTAVKLIRGDIEDLI
mgnify:CR=1 FL=1